MPSLVPVSGCDNASRKLDVIFVHGLDGDAHFTWHPPGQPSDYWPAWLGQDEPDVGVWAADYEVTLTAWKGTNTSIRDQALAVSQLLNVNTIGTRPLVFIAHGTGGLVVKQMLRHASELRAESSDLVRNTKGIVFLSTPHLGSAILSMSPLRALRGLLRTTSTVEDIRPDSPELRDLQRWYAANAHELGIKTAIFYETRKTSGMLVVDACSADPDIPGVTGIPVDEDHVTIAKPSSKEHHVYVAVKVFIENSISSHEENARPVAEVKVESSSSGKNSESHRGHHEFRQERRRLIDLAERDADTQRFVHATISAFRELALSDQQSSQSSRTIARTTSIWLSLPGSAWPTTGVKISI